MPPAARILTVSIAVALTVLNPTCAEREPYIIGGHNATVGQWLWQGSLQFFWQHLCGCALISDRWLVTAGHCLDTNQYDPKYMHVLLGAYDIFTKREGAPKHYLVKKVYRHPEYSDTLQINRKIRNDIGLIELKDHVQMNTFVKTIPMPTQGDLIHGPNCYISGWGATTRPNLYPLRPAPDTPNVLQETPVTEVPGNVCNGPNYGYAGALNTTQQICVTDNGQAGACSGDSGGPLMCSSGNNDWKLIGVTSFGESTCDPEFPSVYTRVAVYRDWIKQVAGV